VIYKNKIYSEILFSNDIISTIISAVFVLLVLVVKLNPGVIIGINSTVLYLTVPILLTLGSSIILVVTITIIGFCVYSITREIVNLGLPIYDNSKLRAEHIINISIVLFFCAFFCVKAIGILVTIKNINELSIEQITSFADLAIVILWMLYLVISIISINNRLKTLIGIMCSGTVLNVSLVLFFIVDSIHNATLFKYIDCMIIVCMSLFFIIPLYRLLRNSTSKIRASPSGHSA